MTAAHLPFTPTLVVGASDLATVLAERRDAMGMTGEQFDDRAGFHERYTIKLENPEASWGRGSLRLGEPTPCFPDGRLTMSSMGGIWLDALGLKLVLVTDHQAQALGAVMPPPRPTAEQKRTRALYYRNGKRGPEPATSEPAD